MTPSRRVKLVNSRGDSLGKSIEWPSNPEGSYAIVQEQIRRALGIAPLRQRLAVRQGEKYTVLDKENILKAAVPDALQVKDLGPQISWQTVFLIEYAGPLLIHLYYLYRQWPLRKIPLQPLAAILFLGHFAKREAESLWVHRFSHDSMPLMNLFKNCGHYWLLSGVLLAREVYSPDMPAAGNSLLWMFTWAAVMIVCEFANLKTHLILANLRSGSATRRAIPRGFGFDWGITCPNYTFEAIAWFAYAMMLWKSHWAWIFCAVSIGQMYLWARKKQIRYIHEFGLEYTRLKRKPMIPMLL